MFTAVVFKVVPFVNAKLAHLIGVRVEHGVQPAKVYYAVGGPPFGEAVLTFRVASCLL